jgi:hypothetical protein
MRVEEGRRPWVEEPPARRSSSRIRWLIVIVVTLLWLYVMIGVGWGEVGEPTTLQPWIIEWLS